MAHPIYNRFINPKVKFGVEKISVTWLQRPISGPFPVWTSDRKLKLWPRSSLGRTLYTLKVSSKSVHGCPSNVYLTHKMNDRRQKSCQIVARFSFRIWHDLFRTWHDFFRIWHDFFRISENPKKSCHFDSWKIYFFGFGSVPNSG